MDLGAQLWLRDPSPLLLLLLTLSLSISSTVQGADHFIQAKAKTDVHLPCEAPEGSNLDDLVLQWTRSDLDEEYVFLFRDGRPLEDCQFQHFRNRVQLIDPTLRSGDLSLKLHNVGRTDSGLYQCHVLFKPHAREKRSLLGLSAIRTVDLTVVIPEPKDKDVDRMTQSGAIPFEASVGFVATLFVSLFLQIWE